MARKPPTTYADMELRPTAPAELPAAAAPAEPSSRMRRKRGGTGGTTLKDRAHHAMIYPSEEAWKAIKRYSLEADCKPHDVLIEAVQQWLDSHGINVRARVPSRDRDITD